MAFLLGLGMFFAILGLVISILMLIAQFKLFEKAGEEGWKVLIPIYNVYIMVKIAFSGKKNWLFALLFLPLLGTFFGETLMLLLTFVSAIGSLYIIYNFARRFGDTGISIASLFIPVIIYPILAFGNYKYTEYTEY